MRLLRSPTPALPRLITYYSTRPSSRLKSGRQAHHPDPDRNDRNDRRHTNHHNRQTRNHRRHYPKRSDVVPIAAPPSDSGRKFTHRYQTMDDSTETELTPHKQLLMDAAAEIRNDQLRREQARPQNVGEGTVKLVTESLGGVALGAAAVVMGPVQGYKQSGPKGLAGGLLGGLAVGVASTTMGIGNGVAGFVHGTSRSASKLNPPKKDPRLSVDQLENFSHTRSSYNEPASPTSTDEEARKEELKRSYLLQRKELYGDIMAEHTAQSAAASMDGLVPPVDNSLYSELEVTVDATPAQIRKAYYKMAQKFHPDKHPDDPDATERFQRISNAYQILSDPVKREEYHRLGEAAANSDSMMDPKALFILMFADFEHIVGDLATATILMSSGAEEADAETTDANNTSTSDPSSATASATSAASLAEERRKEKRKQFQELREAQLVKLLERRFVPWMAGDEAAFIEHAKLEVLYLREQPFGRDCLKTAGYIYRKRAAKLVDSHGPLHGVSSFFEDIGDKAHSLKSKFRAIEGGIKALTSSERAEENETHDDAARREAINTLGAVWLSSVVDIESTLRKVGSKFLHLDSITSANKAEMKRRAEGLKVLGKIYDQV